MAHHPSIPDPAVVVLVGASGSGKSTWAAERFRAVEIVSSDALRGIVGSGPADQEASADAFALMDQIVAARTGRRHPPVQPRAESSHPTSPHTLSKSHRASWSADWVAW